MICVSSQSICREEDFRRQGEKELIMLEYAAGKDGSQYNYFI
jgi:hypothetical protein